MAKKQLARSAKKQTKSAAEKLRKVRQAKTAQRYRSKIRENPAAYNAFKEKDRLRKVKAKAEGKIKSVKDLSSRDQRAIRAKWRAQKADRRRREKENVMNGK